MVKYPSIQGQQCRGGGEDTVSQAGAKQVIGVSSCDATKLSEIFMVIVNYCRKEESVMEKDKKSERKRRQIDSSQEICFQQLYKKK